LAIHPSIDAGIKKAYVEGVLTSATMLVTTEFTSAAIEDVVKPDIIDLNFGCPVPKVTKRGAGSAILRDLPLMDEVARAVVEAVSIPVTAKIRAGWDNGCIVAPVAGAALQDAGIAALTLHPRTTKQLYTGEADWGLIAETRKAITIPLIGNGDIKNAQDAKRMIASRGKRLRINLNIDWFRPDPPPVRRLAYPANIHYNWPRWVEEGLLDEGILRLFQLPFDAVFDDAVAAEMIACCQQRGIPLTVNRYINPDYPEEFERVRQDGRFSGFILYETAGFLHFAADGGCRLRNAAVAEVCQRMKRNGQRLP